MYTPDEQSGARGEKSKSWLYVFISFYYSFKGGTFFIFKFNMPILELH